MAAVNQGRVLVQAHIPFRVIVQKFLDARVPQLGTATQAKYRSHIENHVLADMGELRMCDIDQPTVETWLNNKREDGLSWWTRTDLRNLLSAIFTKALDWKLWNGENPCERVEIGGKAEKREKRLLSQAAFARYLAGLEACEKLVEGVGGQAVRLMVLVAYVTGLRISEVLALQPSDIDVERRTLEVRRRWHRGDIAQPKSQRSKRIRQLGADLAGELSRWIKAHPGTWVFQGSEGNPPDDRNLNQHILRPIAVELGLYWEGFGFHVFRRQSISWRQEAGASSFEAQIAAGHARPATTWDYTITDVNRERQQADALYRRAIGKKAKVLKMKGTA
jgi:integrase